MAATLVSRIVGMIRGAAVGIGSVNTESELECRPQGELLVAGGATEREELTRLGGSWIFQAAAAVASVTAFPTTAALLTLWNGEPAGGKTYVIDDLFTTVAAQTAATAFSASMLAMVGKKTRAVPATPLGGPFSLTGQTAYAGKAVLMASETGLTNDGWFAVGNSIDCIGAVTIAPGPSRTAPINGKILIRPGQALYLSSLATAAAVTVFLGGTFHEVQLLHGV